MHLHQSDPLPVWLRRKAIISPFLYQPQLDHESLHLVLGNILDHTGNPEEENFLPLGEISLFCLYRVFQKNNLQLFSGKLLFYRITTLTNRMTSMSHLKGLKQNINHENPWTIECQQPYNALRTGLSITFDCHCVVVNFRSVGNKIDDIKYEIIITI